AEGGLEAVRIEPLAKVLGITKGSFYWHFADRRALLDAVLVHWSEGRIAAIRTQAATREEPTAVLRRLARLYTQRANLKGLAIELAIRSFARTDEKAAEAIRQVDTERLSLVVPLFIGLGWSKSDAEARAVLFYSTLFGQSLLDAKAITSAVREAAIDALLTPPE
ncbi:MAG TPA: TetR/AcrR family transcriptional regulator, partial [Xanthobacteraceae bacterium]|nr:TetR/AcrR family transcriptional regulator [Xanthobacteraceae bacterium]